ncbi:hypothetical protein BABINDRAFT_17198, partial [Babjeviella inositovora NRRL Y-12698]
MRVLVKQNPRTLALQSETHTLLFRHLARDAASRCAVEFVANEAFASQKFRLLLEAPAHGFLGLINVENDVFLLVITGKSNAARPLPRETVHKIHGVEFVSVNNPKWDYVALDATGYPLITQQDYESTEYAERTPHPCYELRKLLCNGSFLYSTDFDLTSVLQHRGVDVAHTALSWFDGCQTEFMWNSFMMEDMVKFRNAMEPEQRLVLEANGFLTTVIRGFAETFQTYLKELRCSVTMISKQSWKRAGTRFNARGIDDEGYVANFVETEFILYTDKVLYAFTEIRGSVPIFWEQDTTLITPKVTITRSVEATQPVFDRHFARLTEKYGPVHIINLLSTRLSEIGLTKRYAEHLKAHKGSDLALCEFDFHQETAKNGYSQASRILPLVQNSLFENGYFSYDFNSGRVASQQAGIFRTNCLDCLDRTNLIQQVLSTACLNMFLQDHRIKNTDADLFTKHGTLWADHGDQISQIYTGTNALKSSFTRNGKMSFAGALSDMTKSVSRMYINNFVDKGTQVTIDTLLGRNADQMPVQIYDPTADFVASKLVQEEGKFTTYDKATVFTGTYNVNGLATADDLTEWLFPDENAGLLPDMYVLGLQEIIPLTAGNFISGTPSASNASYWEALVGETLNNQGKYTLLRTETMVSMSILLYVQANKLAHVTQVEGASKKTGLGGMGGNKGGCAIRFTYGETTFCFVNCHLAAGVTAVDERSNDYSNIWLGLRFNRNRQIADHDAVVWLGDLNYRIGLENSEVRQRVAQADWSALISHDQLKRDMNARGGAFKGFLERQISFPPTYKYDRGTSVYDTSEKQRVPSWTDRILSRGKVLHQMNYNCVMEVKFSDHKPVYGTFGCQVRFVDHSVRQAMMQQLYTQFKLTESSSLS